MDYKAVYVNGIDGDACRNKIKETLTKLSEVTNVAFINDARDNEYIEIFLDKDIPNALIEDTVKSCGEYQVIKID